MKKYLQQSKLGDVIPTTIIYLLHYWFSDLSVIIIHTVYVSAVETHGVPADNVGESGGEESDEDEWNYFKGGSEKAEEIPSSVPENERKLLEVTRLFY